MSDRPDAPAPVTGRLRRAAPFLLVAGVLAAGAAFVPKMPHARIVELTLDRPAEVTRVDVAWHQGSGEPVEGASWRFEGGRQAPPSLEMTVHLADGRYDVDIQIERESGTSDARRRVEVADADRITIPVR